jgi:murein DD-endopeptidase MepM/ murein hydrolase activator NlpD
MPVPPRQKPSQQPGRTYRGRRRLPKLPSRRYAAVVATAFIGATVVALTAGAVVPDNLASQYGNDASAQTLSVADRLNALDQANRTDDRYGPAVSVDPNAPDVWLLPLRTKFEITTLFEMRWGTMHFGVDMAAPEGTPYYAAHSGVVTLAREDGGYGYSIRIDHGNGVETVYGHSSALFVTFGQHVEAGQKIGLVGSTGFSTGSHLHFEVNVNGGHRDPMRFMMEHGVDIENRQEAASGGTVIT